MPTENEPKLADVVRLKVNKVACGGELLINGVDIAKHVRKVTVTAEVGQLTVVNIEVVTEIDAEFLSALVTFEPMHIQPDENGLVDTSALTDEYRQFKRANAN